MPQLHLYLPQREASELKVRARSKGLTLSRYLASLVRRELAPGWPKGYFDAVFGGWKGEPLERPSQGEPERRDPL